MWCSARILGEFGDDPNRFADARARKNYAGTSPITRASGTRRIVLARYARNRREADGRTYLAMQYLPGLSLTSQIAYQGFLCDAKLIAVAAGVAGALTDVGIPNVWTSSTEDENQDWWMPGLEEINPEAYANRIKRTGIVDSGTTRKPDRLKP